MLAEMLVPVEHVVEGPDGAGGAAVVACSVLVATLTRELRIEEVGRHALAAVEGEARGELQLGQEGDDGLASGEQLVVLAFVVLRTGDVLQRTVDVDAVEVGVVLSGIVGIPDGGVGRRCQYGGNHAATVARRTADDAGAFVGVVGVGDVGIDGEPVGHVVVDLATNVVALETGVDDDAVLTREAARDVIAQLVGAAGDGELVVLHVARAVDFLLPVGLVGEVGGQLQREHALLVHVAYQVHILSGVERVLVVTHAVEGVVGIQGHLGDARLAALGVDDDHAVGSTATVDGCRRGILEHLDVVDVIGSDVVQVVHGHTVDDIERVVATVE